jgi:hypothetical protein
MDTQASGKRGDFIAEVAPMPAASRVLRYQAAAQRSASPSYVLISAS